MEFRFFFFFFTRSFALLREGKGLFCSGRDGTAVGVEQKYLKEKLRSLDSALTAQMEKNISGNLYAANIPAQVLTCQHVPNYLSP